MDTKILGAITNAPDATADDYVVGVRSALGVYTDYKYTMAQLADYIGTLTVITNFTYALATDANYTVPGTRMFIELPVTTAPRNIVMPSPTAGATMAVCNLSTNAGDWTFTGSAVRDAAGASITTLGVTSTYNMIANGITWRVID